MKSLKNFDLIENKIKNYKKLSSDLESKKARLQEVFSLLKDARKDVSLKSVKEQISILNSERQTLKEEISDIKKQVNKEYREAESLILKGIESDYSEVYEKQLSRLYGVKMNIIVKKMGEDFDNETCLAETIIATKDKKQHLKIIKTLSFGIRDVENNRVKQKARVEVCMYTKKIAPGSVIPYDSVLL
ncbi:MAG: hypothetical protein J6Q58_02080 [Clostridia bacterium]|nr:hypothetical protein [Clostridia bacterium]